VGLAFVAKRRESLTTSSWFSLDAKSLLCEVVTNVKQYVMCVLSVLYHILLNSMVPIAQIV